MAGGLVPSIAALRPQLGAEAGRHREGLLHVLHLVLQLGLVLQLAAEAAGAGEEAGGGGGAPAAEQGLEGEGGEEPGHEHQHQQEAAYLGVGQHAGGQQAGPGPRRGERGHGDGPRHHPQAVLHAALPLRQASQLVPATSGDREETHPGQ